MGLLICLMCSSVLCIVMYGAIKIYAVQNYVTHIIRIKYNVNLAHKNVICGI